MKEFNFPKDIKAYQEHKKTPEAQVYRTALATALSIARTYDGTEKSWNELTAALGELEQIIQAQKGHDNADDRKTREIMAAFTYAPTKPKDINDVLDIAINSQNKAIRKALNYAAQDTSEEGENEEEQGPEQNHPDTQRREPSPNLAVMRVRGILLPSDGILRGGMPAGEHAFEPRRFEQRYAELIALLRDINIFTEDLLIFQGETHSSMMREESYVVVEIPRLGRSVLVCDQVGEAAFVVNGRVSVDTLLTHTKDDLFRELGTRIQKVIRKNPDQWKHDISSLLTSEEHWTNVQQIRLTTDRLDVREFYAIQLANALRALYPTAQDWVGLTEKNRLSIKIDGKGLISIATTCGTGGNPTNKFIDHLLLGEHVYGANDPVIKKTLEQKRSEVEGTTFLL